MRSRTGCLTCRKRKLKCDEARPTCANCAKGNRSCVPSPGLVFRHQQNASMNATGGQGGLGRFYNYKETFAADNIWVDIPTTLSFVHVTDPYAQDSEHHVSTTSYSDDLASRLASYGSQSQQTVNAEYTYGLEALSAAATSGVRTMSSTDQGPEPLLQSGRRQSNSAIVNALPADTGLSALDPRLYQTALAAALRDAKQDDSEEYVLDQGDFDVLLSHFRKGPGHWMDIFDCTRYFSGHLPDNIKSNTLLRHCCLALSAKTLARVGLSVRQRMVGAADHTEHEWLMIASRLYDKAVHALRTELAIHTRSAMDTGSAPNVVAAASTSDEIVAAIAMLCVYELVDATEAAWEQHLDGARALINTGRRELARSNTESYQIDQTPPALVTGLSRVKSAIYWNFIRQDMLHAYVQDTTTGLDTEDGALWRFLGLCIDSGGRVTVPEHLDAATSSDMFCNALVLIAMRVVNFAATSTNSENQQRRIFTWNELQKQLDAWYESRLVLFPLGESSSISAHGITTGQTSFAHGQHASTMQWYHFARIQLIFARQSPTDSPRLRARSTDRPLTVSSKDLTLAAQHAQWTLSIAMARPDDAARVHSQQPLYVAGQVLGLQAREKAPSAVVAGLQACLTEVLQAIERETGWATQYRIDQLQHQWQQSN